MQNNFRPRGLRHAFLLQEEEDRLARSATAKEKEDAENRNGEHPDRLEINLQIRPAHAGMRQDGEEQIPQENIGPQRVT